MKHVNYLIMLLMLLVSTVSNAQTAPFPGAILGLTIANTFYPNDAAESTDIHTNLVYVPGTITMLPTSLLVHSTADMNITVVADGTFFPQPSNPATAQVIVTTAMLVNNQDTNINLGNFDYYNGVRQNAFKLVISVSYNGVAVNHTYFIYNDALPLPVTLTKFEAKPFSSGSLLTWGTAMEKNFDYFCVEASVDGVGFQQVGRVPARGGNSTGALSYSFTDSYQLDRITYYRLRIVDRDGTYSFSPVRIVSNTLQSGSSVIVPFGNYFYSFPITKGDAPTGLMLFDTAGRLLVKQDDMSPLTFRPVDGQVYFLKLITRQGSIKAQTIR